MKKTMNFFILVLTILSLTVPVGGTAFASSYNNESIYIIESVAAISVNASRSTSTTGKVTASGYLTARASSVTTKATLYEYNSSTGTLTPTSASPVMKTIYNCSVYSFTASFPVQAAKKYRVKLEITDVTNGMTNKNTFYSNVF